eukprot:TRINITY_DN3626_c0_g5_i2.p1 TRINITY_DN3626_c0_g5~~TRINITY_DN3626_c0_g5_i2.p1  ORF type:complete len:217 (-),score=64.60 TRINITY_DN3626_c0_g5_i2:122-772(-)
MNTGEITTHLDSITANKVKIGKYMIMNENRPCKVIEASKSKPGKHGTAKIRFVGIDLFTNKKYDHLASSGANVSVPEVIKSEWKLESIDDETIKVSRELRPGESAKGVDTPHHDDNENNAEDGEKTDKQLSKKEMRKLQKARRKGNLTEDEEAKLGGSSTIDKPEETKKMEKTLPLPVDEELADKIKDAFSNGHSVLVSVLQSMGQEAVTGFREVK